MSRRRHAGESSLELLLDTICNTFGGVLFVAILIVVMLRMTSRTTASSDAEQVSEAEMLELEQRQELLQATSESLSRAAAELERQLAEEDAASEQVEQLKKAQSRRDEALQTRLATLARIAGHQSSINRSAREIDDLEKGLQSALTRRQDAETRLKSEVAKRSQNAEFSRAHSTSKSEIQTVLRYGRLYVLHRHGAGGTRLGLNTDDFMVLEETGGKVHATPLPQSGSTVADTPESTAQITARLGEFNARRHYIAVIVWPDSYGQFRYLKKVLVQAGFEYRVIPAKQDDKFVDRGGSSDGVQ